jgi:outer membrane receptor protein involved in Fe transport
MHKTHLGYGIEAIAAGSRGTAIGRTRPLSQKIWKDGAGGRKRTGTLSPELDFERPPMADHFDPADLFNTAELFIGSNRFPSVPANAGNLWVKYDTLGDFKGLSVAGGLNVIGSMPGDNANSFQLPQYTLVNGMISYRFSRQGTKITAQLNVRNIFNTTYYTSSTPISWCNIVIGAPHAILGSLRLEF